MICDWGTFIAGMVAGMGLTAVVLILLGFARTPSEWGGL